jgi:magnesium transporter
MPSAAELMMTDVPRANPRDTVCKLMEQLRKFPTSQADHIYLIDGNLRLVGQVPIEKLLVAEAHATLDLLAGHPPIEVHPDDEAEAVAFQAVRHHDGDVAVVDAHRKFLGAIPTAPLFAILHKAHIDDLLLMGGVDPSHPAPSKPDNIIKAYWARVPWLFIGLLGGFLAGGLASYFEDSLKEEIMIALFLPLVLYMSDAIGTQTEAVLVRSLAAGQTSLRNLLRQEGAVGALIGITLGTVGGLGLLLWGSHQSLAAVLGITLGLTSLVATLMACLLPWCFFRLGVDPAVASGPIATVLQDILTVVMYLSIATLLL